MAKWLTRPTVPTIYIYELQLAKEYKVDVLPLQVELETQSSRPEEDAISMSRSQAWMIQWLNDKQSNLPALLFLH